MVRILNVLLVTYVILSYGFGLVVYGYSKEANNLRIYEEKRLNLAVAISPILIPAGMAILYGKRIAEEERENHGMVGETCRIVFGFCGPKR